MMTDRDKRLRDIRRQVRVQIGIYVALILGAIVGVVGFWFLVFKALINLAF